MREEESANTSTVMGELRRRAQVRALEFFGHDLDATDSLITGMTDALVDFVAEALTLGDISSGVFIHWLRHSPVGRARMFAPVACGRTFNLFTVPGRRQAIDDPRYATCPRCKLLARIDAESHGAKIRHSV